jgi:thymidylate kinase
MKFAKFATTFFGELKQRGIQYCVLRNFDGLPDELTGRDIDLWVERSAAKALIDTLKSMPGIEVVRVFEKPSGYLLFIYGVETPRGGHALEIDLCWNFSWYGLEYYDPTKLVGRLTTVGREPDTVNRPGAASTAGLLLMSNLLRYGFLPEKYRGLVGEAIAAHGHEIQTELAERAGGAWASRLLAVAVSETPKLSLSSRVGLVTALAARQKSLAVLVGGFAQDLGHRLKVLVKPPRLLLAFVGPDGAGKTTVIDSVEKSLMGLAVDLDIRHLKLKVWLTRSRVERRGIVVDPHGLPPRGRLVSALKIAVWAFGERLYWTLYRPKHPSIIIVDRYFDELQVDHLRYRYSGPIWLVELLKFVVPRPDLLFVLTAPPAVIFQRKQEVSSEALEAMLKRYRALGAGDDNVRQVDTSGPVSEISTNIVQSIKAKIGVLRV